MRPDPRHARYPFFAAAREAVQSADIAPPALVTQDDPAVERGVERVTRALMAGTVASESPERWRPRDELLSYPIARILVSLVDSTAAVEKYAAAEAETAQRRFVEDFERDDGLKSVSAPTVTLETFLQEFDLSGAVTRETLDSPHGAGWFRIDVGDYLRLTDPDWGDGWRLVNRELRSGRVRIDREELYDVLSEAVRRRVADGLPFDVRGNAGGQALADALSDELETLRGLLSERDAPPARDVNTVVPDLFPPCVTALVERARDEGDLPTHSAFTLTAFLTGIGMDDDGIAAFCGLDPETVEFRAAVLEDGDDVQYPPPSCASMEAYGDCVNPDERCESISHPLAYYANALADAESAEPRSGE